METNGFNSHEYNNVLKQSLMRVQYKLKNELRVMHLHIYFCDCADQLFFHLLISHSAFNSGTSRKGVLCKENPHP